MACVLHTLGPLSEVALDTSRSRYRAELRSSLGLDEGDLRHLAELRETVVPHLHEVTVGVPDLLVAERTGDDRERCAAVVNDVVARLCGPESLERQVASLSELTGLSLGEVFSLVGLLHARLEKLIDAAFDAGRASRLRASLGRRVVTELSLIGMMEPSGSSVRISVVDRDSVADVDPDGSDSSARNVLAHEIRNSLNGASLHLTFLRRSLDSASPDEETLRAASVIAQEIARVAGLVEETLESAERTPADAPSVSLRSICEQAVAHVAQGLELDTESAGGERSLSATARTLLDLVHDVAETALQSRGRVLLTARRHRSGATVQVENWPEPDGANPPSSCPESIEGLDAVVRSVALPGSSLQVETRPGRTTFHIKLLRAGGVAVNE